MAPRADGSLKMDRKRLSPIIRICIDVVESVYANHELVDAAGKLISAEALFSEWVYAQKDETRPNALSEEGFLELLEVHENLSQSLDDSFLRFSQDPENRWKSLAAALHATREKLLSTAGIS
jgi:hypothetical protein